MIFYSILYNQFEGSIEQETNEVPDFFSDLNLDQIVNGITAGKDAYNLKPVFYTPLKDEDAIKYRQNIARDLESESLLARMKTFAHEMVIMRRYLSLIEKLDYDYHKKGWFLEAVMVYCNAVICLERDLSQAELKSQGLLSFHDYLSGYVDSDKFKSLLMRTSGLKFELSKLTYCMIIDGSKVYVRQYEHESDYSIEVETFFEKFKQGAVKDYTSKLTIASGMNHVEAAILNKVSKLYPEIFSRLDAYCSDNKNFLDETIAVFDREIQFYITYLEYITKLKQTRLDFCYPQISTTTKEIYNYQGFDLALAHKLVNEQSTVIPNDFYLQGKERIFVITGPNQGGKTTFARTFGQLHYLACLGLPVPGRDSRLFLFNAIFTHFEKEESIHTLRGKLQEDLVRIHQILSRTTSDSLVILNEIFTSTTLEDAVLLSQKVMERIIQFDLLCVWVTFIDEMASISEKTVSMLSTVDHQDPALRTFKIVRKPADGLAHAMAIAEKHGLTYKQIINRIML